MFCPKCGAQNRIEQKFCRSCGQSLSTVRMALEGRIDEVAATLEKDVDKIASGALTLAIFAVIALIASLFTGFGTVTINLIVGLLIAGPAIYKSLVRLERSVKLLNKKGPLPAASLPQAENTALNQAQPANVVLPSVPDTDPLGVSQNPSSVTEHTTFQLKQPER